MSVLWIVEKAKAPAPTFAASLIGDFAVRAFASVESLTRLARLSRTQRPDLLLVDLADFAWSEDRLIELVTAYLPSTPTAVVSAGVKAGDRPLAAGTPGSSAWRLHRLARPLDALGLGAVLDQLIRSQSAGRGRVVRYRDVHLDCEKLQCTVHPGDASMSLPLKEAQLLRLFIERACVCLSRDEIRRAIWDDIKVTPRTIDSHVSRLRKRLQHAEARIESVYGGGYVLR